MLPDILGEQQLEVIETYRNGPRYWVGKVRRGEDVLLLKTVVDDTAWVSPASGEEFRPSDQLRAEIMVMQALGQHGDGLAGDIPALVAASLDETPWMLRVFTEGRDMAAGRSPFIYRPEFFEMATTTAVVDFVLSLQRLTPVLHDLLLDMPHTRQTILSAKMFAVDLERPTELLEPFAVAIIRFLEARRELHDGSRDTLSHGQVYPPHIYLTGGRVSLIDWENASLNNRFQDLAAMWIRGVGRPDWQEQFVELLKERGLLQTPADWNLWRLEILLQGAGNLNYFYWSKFETAAEQAEAIAALRGYIREVLAHG